MRTVLILSLVASSAIDVSVKAQRVTISVNQIVQGLQSPSLSVRVDTVTKLSAKVANGEAVFGDPQVLAALLDLLRREHAALTSADPADRGISNAAVTGESYGEYHSQVMGLGMAAIPLLPVDEQRVWLDVLARDPYVPESHFATWLAGYGDFVIDALLDHATRGGSRSDRANAYAVLAQMFASTAFMGQRTSQPNASSLSLTNRQRALKAVNEGLNHSDGIVARETINALRRNPSSETLVILEQYFGKARGQPGFSSRGEYQRSLQEEVERSMAAMRVTLRQRRP